MVRARRVASAIVLVGAIVATGVACQLPSTLPSAKAGAKCARDGDVARNATHVLQCKKNHRWTAIMPIGQADALYRQFMVTTTTPVITAPPPAPSIVSPVTYPTTTEPVYVPPTTVPPTPETQPWFITPGSPAPGGRPVSSDAVSADGRYVLVTTGASGSGGSLFLVDRTAATTTFVADTNFGVMSTNGAYVVFVSFEHLTPDDNDLHYDAYRWSRASGAIDRVTVPASGPMLDSAPGELGGVSDDGRFVAFATTATNVVNGDGNGARDVFVRDMVNGTTAIATTTSAGVQGDAGAYPTQPRLSASGRYVAFNSTANNFRPGDTDGDVDVFRKDLTTGALVAVTAQHNDPGSYGWWLAGMSADGDRLAVQEGWASTLVTVTTSTRTAATGTPVELPGTGGAAQAISPNGRFTGSMEMTLTNGQSLNYLLVTDHSTSTTRRIDTTRRCDVGGWWMNGDHPIMHLTDQGHLLCSSGVPGGEYQSTLWPSPF